MEQEQEQQQPVKLEFLGSLEILQTVKNAQSQNGLKHGDYLRYRKYCTKKVKKLRKGMKFTYGKGKKFEKKDIIEENPNDPKLLHALLYDIEHDWAYAMDVRQVMDARGDDSANRMKFHVANKIKKGYKKALRLLELCKERTSPNTASEAEAYCSFLGGFYYHEKERWNEALSNYIKSRQIYNEMVKVSDSLQNAVFKEKIDQLDQSIRYVYQQNGGSMLDSVEVILSKFKGDKIEIEANQQQQSNINKSLIEVSFHGQKYPIKNSKVITIYQNIQSLLVQLKENQEKTEKNLDNIFNIYLELFSNYDDAIKLISKDKEDPKNSDAEKEIYNCILNYFGLQKYTQQLERNSLHIRLALQKFDKEKGLNNLPELMTKKAFKLKLTRPAEIVKLCDNYLQVMKQIVEIERHNPNLDFFRQLDGLEIFHRAIRCYYVSVMYYANDKHKETLSLLHQTESYLDYSSSKLQEGTSQEHQQQFEQFSKQVQSLKIKVKVQFIEQSLSQQQGNQEEKLAKDVSNLQLDGKSSNITIAKMVEESVEGEKHEIDIQKLSNIPIDDIPPKPQISGCKPIFFDLADQNIQYPNIDNKIKGDKKGGFFGKFNIFGKK